MTYRIQLFAGLAEAAGQSVVILETAEPDMTAGKLKERLAGRYPQAARAIMQSFVAKNQAYAPEDTPVSEEDELALIPPVSGGHGDASAAAPPPVEDETYAITEGPISVEEVAGKVHHGDHGAVIVFVGSTRERTAGKRTVLLEYEAYVPMALATMKQIGREIAVRWPGTRCAITHRLGRVNIGETSVAIAVSSPHRAESYEASRYAIERLKQIVPIWKKEIWEDGSEWKGHQQGPWDPTAPTAPTGAGAADDGKGGSGHG